MNEPIIKILNDRMCRIYHATGRPPKRLSLGTDRWPELMAQADPNGAQMLIFTSRRALRFCGLPLRVRNYARERSKKWYGPGPMLSTT